MPRTYFLGIFYLFVVIKTVVHFSDKIHMAVLLMFYRDKIVIIQLKYRIYGELKTATAKQGLLKSRVD